MHTEDLNMEKRRALYIFIKGGRKKRELSKYGELIYESRKAGYVCLYVSESELQSQREKIEKLNYVEKVEVGQLTDLTADFAEAFGEINDEIKNDLPGLED